MGYKIVAVNPLKQFPFPSYGLANIASLDDARRQILNQRFASEKTKELEERWPKIGPALEAHLARQERRLTHFKISCRFFGCDNPRRQKRGRSLERNTKAHRPSIKPLFCGAHVGLRRLLTEKQLAELHAASEKRVVVTK